MPAPEARTHLLENYENLRVVNNQHGDVWRTTIAGTPWVLLRWGYKEGDIRFELHVHGKKSGNGYALNSNDSDVKVCAERLKAPAVFLNSTQWALVRGTVRDLV